MRLRTWWCRTSMSVAMIFGVGQAAAYAEVTTYANDQNAPYFSAEYNDHRGYVSELDTINRRLRALETRDARVTDVVNDAANDGPLKKVDIQSKPNHKLRGRLFYDTILNDDSVFVDREDESGFDTARMGIEGFAFENVEYKIEIEFEGTEVDFKDVYMEYKSLPVIGAVRVGHFKEPMSLEELTSSRYITFMERSLPLSAFIPGRNFGFMAYNDVAGNEDVSAFIGTFREGSDDSPTGVGSERDDAGDWVMTTRMACNPYYDEASGGRYLVHLGGSYSYRTTNSRDAAANKEKTFSTGRELGTGGGALSARVDNDDDWNLFGGEAAVVWGPATLQGEYYHANTGGMLGDDFHGGYVQFAYFLTGENRGYKRSAKAFDKVDVLEPAFAVNTADGCAFGLGAWQPAIRWSYVDLTQGTSGNRGFQDNVTCGMNWYLNTYARMMFDYVYEDIVRSGVGPSHAHQWGCRCQVHW